MSDLQKESVAAQADGIFCSLIYGLAEHVFIVELVVIVLQKEDAMCIGSIVLVLSGDPVDLSCFGRGRVALLQPGWGEIDIHYVLHSDRISALANSTREVFGEEEAILKCTSHGQGCNCENNFGKHVLFVSFVID